MTLRERILAVYRGETPDVVPYMLDLSHWFYHRRRAPWDLAHAYVEPERDLIAFHRSVGAGFYLPNLAAFVTTDYGGDVASEVLRTSRDGRPAITWRLSTPLGTIQRTRVWEERSYSWAIAEWGVRSEQDLRVLAHALGTRVHTPHWDRYRAWVGEVGDWGVVYLPFGYSAMGHLLSLWTGIEGTVYAAADWPATLREVVNQINANALALVDLAASSPAEVILMGDNLSGDVQPPPFFDRWSQPFYAAAIRRLRRAGKRVALHVDGRLRGALRMAAAVGADCADAVTPAPMGDLTPAECRDESGPRLILSGGVAPGLWLPETDVALFDRAVKAWLELKWRSPALIAGAGDQVPPGADPDRIERMRDLVERHGRF